MASYSFRAIVSLRVGTTMLGCCTRSIANFPIVFIQKRNKRSYSIKSSSLDPPDVSRLAESARISLTPEEVQEFGPKIHQVIECFHCYLGYFSGSDNFKMLILKVLSQPFVQTSMVIIYEKMYLKHLRIGKLS
ncbi:uncharacterized protein LOC130803976 isoform X2 [Amaranthus tricolor]|uniref:uncharacterized protein LOC130803976 isoform X2 n=1 Tax=Amaranthus tricolor TaxID=29722 RepID=UPI00258A959A|nr:uncharacterized protein LOC130803976 isoform X2 [Amaranthus tricolor]